MIQMKNKKYTQIIFSAAAVILIGILAQAAPGLGLRLLLLVSGAGGVILYFCRDWIPNSAVQRTLLWTAVILFTAALTWSAASAGSPAAYGKKVAAFFLPGAPEAATDALYRDMSAESLRLKQTLDSLDEQLAQTFDELELISAAAEERQFLSENDDVAEVEKICAVIQENLKKDAEKDNPSFTDIRDNAHSLELFYKIYLARELYHYSSFIKALEVSGIDCKSMSVDKYTLMLWDVEYYFSLYNMRQSVLDDAAQGVVYEENKEFLYQEFKVSKQNGYSDVFDYGTWRLWYSPRSAQEVADLLDEQILRYYQKFNMNFRR